MTTTKQLLLNPFTVPCIDLSRIFADLLVVYSVAGAGFGWYLVVDSSLPGQDEVVDVWVRWRGW